MRHAGSEKLLQHVKAATIPMMGRMIHGKKKSGELYEESQAYDIHGRVRLMKSPIASEWVTANRYAV